MEQGEGATAGRREPRQAVGHVTVGRRHFWCCWPVLLLQHPDAHRAVWLSPSREASSPLFVLLCAICLILLITYKSKENK